MKQIMQLKHENRELKQYMLQNNKNFNDDQSHHSASKQKDNSHLSLKSLKSISQQNTTDHTISAIPFDHRPSLLSNNSNIKDRRPSAFSSYSNTKGLKKNSSNNSIKHSSVTKKVSAHRTEAESQYEIDYI